MKIAYLSSSVIPSRSANSIQVMRMCQAFAEEGHVVFLYARQGPVFEEVGRFYGLKKIRFEILFSRLPRAWAGSVLYAVGGLCKARSWRVDLAYGRNLAACCLCASLGIPVIFESHRPESEAGWIDRWLFAFLLRKKGFRGLVVITNALKAYYLKNYPSLEGCKVFVAPDGANVTGNIEVSAVPANGDGFRVGYFGHMYPGKSMEIVEKIAERCPDFEFHLYGGTDEDLRRWTEHVRGLGNVIFHGFIRPSEVPSAMQSVDVLIAPYSSRVFSEKGRLDISNWTSPMKVFEYMGAGRPIVCSDLPVIREVLVHERNSILCNPEELEPWLDALSRLQSDAALRKRLSEAALLDLSDKYRWDIRARNIGDFVERRLEDR